MRKAVAQVGVGLTLLAIPAIAETPSNTPDRARAAALERLRARLDVERAEAEDTAQRIAAASIWRHARAAPAE
jgi:hypothetical protein